MNNPRLHLYHEDARPFLRRIDARYDVISVDAYRQPYIPFYLTTVEFFETVRDRLAPGGVLVVNAGHPEGQDDFEKVLDGDDRRRLPVRAARPDRGHEHADRGEPRAAVGGRLRDASRTPAAGAAPDRACGRPRGSRRRCAAARSTPTTRRRSSG